MHVAILTFDGFNEIDSFVALGILNRLKSDGWTAEIVCPSPRVVSMNGVPIEAQQPLELANEADAVIFGSGTQTRAIARDEALLARLRLDPARQLIAGQCSGALLMARLGLLGDSPACTDVMTKPWVVEAGVRVLDAPFYARGSIATAGGCLASQYLATWLMAKHAGREAAAKALSYVAPVGERDAYVTKLLAVVEPFLGAGA